jgi:hypothetical protein
VASFGYFLYLAGSKISDSVENPLLMPCDVECTSEETETETETETDDDNIDKIDEEVNPPVLYPIEDANHDVAAVTDGVFCFNHYDRGDSGSEYIVMMYSSESSAFVYWCNCTPNWDVLQTTARKFVTENRCAGLYTVQTMVTDAEETETGSPKEDPSGDDVKSDDGKTLSTCVDNIHVRQGRLSSFRTSEQALSSHSEVNYKNFASMRRRAGFAPNK